MDLLELKKNYGYNAGNPKWLSSCEELLGCIGQKIVQYNFSRKKADDPWSVDAKFVGLNSMGSFDKKTMTYKIKVQVKNGEYFDDTIEDDVITPEGLSMTYIQSKLNSDKNDLMLYKRYGTISDYYGQMEQYNGNSRFISLFDSNKNLTFQELGEYSNIKEQAQEYLVKYASPLFAVITPTKKTDKENELEYEDEVWRFKIGKIKLSHEGKENYRLLVWDSDDNLAISIPITNNLDYDYYDLGGADLKIINAQS